MNPVRSFGVVLGLSFLAACSGALGEVAAPTGPFAAEAPTFAAMKSSAILAAALSYPATKVAGEEAPLSLTSSEGVGLALSSLDARAVAEGPLAFTELHLTFENPENRVIEGRFAITLPPGATVSRLAMKSEAGWQEAEVVERRLAQRAYEDALHRRQDPALLEKEAGNEFRARIFPISPKASKEIILSYSQEIPAGARYRLPLRGLPEVGHLKVSANIGGEKGGIDRQHFKPDRDFDANVPPLVSGLRAEDIALVPIRPELGAEKAEVGDVAILFDTSASRALGFALEVERLGALVAELAKSARPGSELTLIGFDQTADRIYQGPITGFSKRELELVLARRPLGATDLAGALASLGHAKPHSRAVLMTDAIATAGGPDAAVANVRALRGTIDRLDVVLSGGIRDDELAKRLARGTLAKDGVVLDGAGDIQETARRIALGTCSGITVDIAGASWVWPSRLDGMQPGDQAFVYALMSKDAKGPTLSVSLGGGVNQKVQVGTIRVEKPLIERAAANAEIARLVATRDAVPASELKRRDELKSQIVLISTSFRVVSDFTALLVLESDRDYARFGLDRRALADILTVGDRGGVALVHRSEPVVLEKEPPPPPPSNQKRPAGVAAGNKGGGARSHQEPPKKAANEAPYREEADKKLKFDPSDDKPATEAQMRAPQGTPTAPAAAAPADRDGDGIADPAVGVEGGIDAGDSGRARGGSPAATGSVTTPAPPTAPRGNVTVEMSRPRPPSSPVTIPRQPPLDMQHAPDAMPEDEEEQNHPPAYAGKMAEVMDLLAASHVETAVIDSVHWQAENPGDVMPLVALGESLEAAGNRGLAARAYGSILDLFPARADMRRFAAERLERLGAAPHGLATDAFAKAAVDRPDHLNGHRLYAFALLRDGRYADAFTEIETGLAQTYPPGRFLGGDRILRDDAGLIATAWIRVDPKRQADLEVRLAKLGAKLPTQPSLRFVLYWETDANDVDFHIRDASGGHAFYKRKELPSGGELYADVTTGYGPECFTIEGTPRAYPYRLQIHYYSKGPMGYGMGKLEIIEHDGKGNLRFQERPYVVMNDKAFVDLGTVDGPLK